MNKLKINNKYKYLISFIFIGIFFLYQSQNLYCFAHNNGFLKKNMDEVLNANIKLKEGWCPSIESFIQNTFFSENQPHYIFVKNSFYNSWDFSDFIMFSKPFMREIKNDEPLKFSWGNVHLIGQYGNKGVITFQSENKIRISTSDIDLLNDIEVLE